MALEHAAILILQAVTAKPNQPLIKISRPFCELDHQENCSCQMVTDLTVHFLIFSSACLRMLAF